jgi:hypothetical protein
MEQPSSIVELGAYTATIYLNIGASILSTMTFIITVIT